MKSVNSRGSHWGDLGDHRTGFSVVHLIDGHRGGGPLVFPVLLFDFRPLPATEIPGNTSKPKGAPRKYHDGPSSWPR